MARLAYFIHGRGRGHASRARPILGALVAAGHRPVIFAGGDGAGLLDGLEGSGSCFEGIHEVPPVLPGISALWTAPRRLRGDLRRLREIDPALVISDGDAPSVWAARRLGIPALSVGHDQLFRHVALPPGLPAGDLAYERAIAGLTSGLAGAAVAVHFLPIAGPPAGRRLRIARPDRPPGLRGPVTDDGGLVAYLRDGLGVAALRVAAAAGWRIRVFGGFVGPLPPGITAAPLDREGFHRALRGCAGVIATAGSNLLAECVLLGKPILALHRAGDREQRLNGILAARAGVAETAMIDGTGFNRHVLRFLERMGRRDFARVDLEGALPPVSRAVVDLVAELLGSG